MKPMRLVLFLVFVGSWLPLTALAERGWELTLKGRHESLYFSPDSVQTTNELTEVWIVRNLHEPHQTAEGQVLSVLETIMINCQNLNVSTTMTLFFKREFARGQRVELSATDRPQVSPVRSNLPLFFLMRVCGFNA
jgi:hypothetical protein